MISRTSRRYLPVRLVVPQQGPRRGWGQGPGQARDEPGEEGRQRLQRHEGYQGPGRHPAHQPVLVPHAAAGPGRASIQVRLGGWVG
jgi:hypothetical protein